MLEDVKFIHGGKFVSRGIWKHPERLIDSTELIVVLRGSAYITEGDVEYSLSEGDVFRLDSSVKHFGHRESTERVVFYWLHYTGGTEAMPPKLFRPESTEELEMLCRQLLHYEKAGTYPTEMTDCLMRVIILALIHDEKNSSESRGGLINEVCEWIRCNCDLGIKVRDVAEHFGYNEDYLCRAFKSVHPEGIKTYIDGERMRRIRLEITRGEKTLKEIASDFSFSEYKYFLKYFKYHEGISPTKYKETYCNLHINNH